MYTQEYEELWLTVADEDFNIRTNYWYCITHQASAHTAFETKQGLMRWLRERGLKLTAPLPKMGVFTPQKIEGTYITAMHMDQNIFYALPAILETKTLSNGQYTLARITEQDGIRTVHTLNPNVKGRVVFEYFATAAVMM